MGLFSNIGDFPWRATQDYTSLVIEIVYLQDDMLGEMKTQESQCGSTNKKHFNNHNNSNDSVDLFLRHLIIHTTEVLNVVNCNLKST